jgi:MFS transporter, SET family, sugar efflux transporter
VRRVLVGSTALLWGLQFAFLNPALALILVALYDATPAQVGWVLAVYNASGFLASILLPAYADRRHEYLRPMLACGILTLALAGLLALAGNLPVAVVALTVLGGPAGVGMSLLYAQLRHTGAPLATILNTRAMVSAAWIAGPPVATMIISAFGNSAILLAIAAVALINIVTTATMIRQQSQATSEKSFARTVIDDHLNMSRARVVMIMAAFVLLQATNNAAVAIMNLYVTQTLGLNLIWAGIALGVGAGLEIPALVLIGRLSRRYSSLTLIASGCLAGIAYYTAMIFVTGPTLLLTAQVLNAWFFAAVAGVGITLFQQIIPRPGLASGLFTNTRRIGAIASGAIIAFGASSAAGYRGTFVACLGLTVLALAITGLVARTPVGRPPPKQPPVADTARPAAKRGHEPPAKRSEAA